MSRPFTDITKAIAENPIKNGTIIDSVLKTGYYSKYDRYVKNTPVIEDIQSKYGYRFYNGIFVKVLS